MPNGNARNVSIPGPGKKADRAIREDHPARISKSKTELTQRRKRCNGKGLSPMPYLNPPTSLAKIRYRARRRGLRILRDGTGNFSVISMQIEPPRPVLGLDHVPLW
jgi:hypothetical protein